MIVEDDALVALVYQTAIEDGGFRFAGIACDTDSALGLAREARPQLAVVDGRLRDGQTGGDIALALHRDHGVRVVFLTGDPWSVPPEVAAVCHEVLAKPVPMSALICSLEAAGLRAEGAPLP